MGRAPHLGTFSSPSKRDIETAAECLERVGIAHLGNKSITQISGGEKQMVLVARVLAQQPQVMLLDEPTSHLDFRNQTLILRMDSQAGNGWPDHYHDNPCAQSCYFILKPCCPNEPRPSGCHRKSGASNYREEFNGNLRHRRQDLRDCRFRNRGANSNSASR